jgi:hypothetical protein
MRYGVYRIDLNMRDDSSGRLNMKKVEAQALFCLLYLCYQTLVF